MCPSCQAELICPCESCEPRHVAKGDMTPRWVWQDNGEVIECPICGFAAHADEWEYFDYQEYKKSLDTLPSLV